MLTTASDDDKRIAAAAAGLPPRPGCAGRRACFSFAAYAKAVVAQLRAAGVAVASGLSEVEISAVESSHGFAFPPDLRAILREGLPVGSRFPDWRSGQTQQLRALLSLPVVGLLREVSGGRLWHPSWGPPPENLKEAAEKARAILFRAPALVPIYGSFYMPIAPNLPGNPVFYISGGEVRLAALDLVDFFRPDESAGVPVPAWAAASARRIDVWTELEAAGNGAMRSPVPGGAAEMDRWFEEIKRRLRDGGWSEEEVADMMEARPDGEVAGTEWTAASDRADVARRVRSMALELLRGGWSAEEVTESMGLYRGPAGTAGGPVTWRVEPTKIFMELW